MALRQRSERDKPHVQFIYARSLAKRRNIEWALTEAEYLTLRLLPCHYCGFDLPPTGMGIDRRDFKLSYCIVNVVPCCTECNLAKNSSFTADEMMLIGAVIAQIKTKRQQQGQAHKCGLGAPRKY